MPAPKWKPTSPELIVAVKAELRRDPNRSNAVIGRQLGVTRSAVNHQRMKLQQAGEIGPRAPLRDFPKQEGHPHLTRLEVTGRDHPATQSGALSKVLKKPVRERILADLKRQLPACDEQLLVAHAEVGAMIEMLSAWTDAHGLIRDHRRGEIYNAVEMLRRLIGQYDRQHVVLLELQGALEHASAQTLESYVAGLDRGHTATPDSNGEPRSGRAHGGPA